MSPKVLFVCTGNICRSPMAEAILRHQARAAGRAVEIRSAGTGSWHVGEPPDARAVATLRRYQVSCDGQRARQVSRADLEWADYILALDASHLASLRRLGAPPQKTRLLMDYAPPGSPREVPDPYYDDTFDEVYQLIVAGCQGLLADIQRQARTETP